MNTYLYVKNRVCDKCDYSGLYIETIFDAGMIIYDLGSIGYGIAVGDDEMVDNGMVDLGVDVASLFLPVPAGSTKVARVSTKPAVKPEIKQNKDFGGGQDGKVDVNLVFLRRERNFIVIVMDIALILIFIL